FSMRYTVIFERATADFDLARGAKPLHLHHDGQTTEVELDAGMGYDHELAYFLDCVRRGEKAERVPLADAAESVKLIERELASLNQNAPK
ncbi:MAG: gfo/Idh/MocA family oxidoreductase, partial [Planctomycetota bacterium]